jgi:predicted transcriptional regulator
MTLAEILKKARIKAGLTQQQLADLCNMHQAYIAKIESGKIRKLQYTTYSKISKIIEL